MKLRKFFTIAAVACTTALTACEVSIKDGKVPEKYMEAAKQYVGDYNGQFEGQNATLSLRMAADGTATLNISTVQGSKAFIKGCTSSIGALRYADADKDSQTLQSAKFKLATNCNIEGDLVELYFDSANQVQVEIVEKTKIETDWGPDHCYYSGPYGGQICTPSTTTKVVPYSWLTGSFRRN